MILQFALDRNGDPDRRKLRTILEAQFAYERMSAARSLFVHLLAVAGVIVWLDAIWPELLPLEVRLFTLVLWGGILVGTLCAVVEEYVSFRRLRRYTAGKKGVTLDDLKN